MVVLMVPETRMSQKMVLGAKRKEMERFKRIKVYRVVTRESMERDEEEKMISIKCLAAREFNTGDKRGGLVAMRTVISRAMTKCENGATRSIMLAVVKTAFLYGDARRSLYVELPPEDPLAASGRYVGKLQRAMCGTDDAPMIWQDHLWKTLFDMKFKESVQGDATV